MAKKAMVCILCFLRFLLFQDETDSMHPNFANADRLSGEVIGAAIEVHRIMGPGLLESIYERCLLHKLELRGVPDLVAEMRVERRQFPLGVFGQARKSIRPKCTRAPASLSRDEGQRPPLHTPPG